MLKLNVRISLWLCEESFLDFKRSYRSLPGGRAAISLMFVVLKSHISSFIVLYTRAVVIYSIVVLIFDSYIEIQMYSALYSSRSTNRYTGYGC